MFAGSAVSLTKNLSLHLSQLFVGQMVSHDGSIASDMLMSGSWTLYNEPRWTIMPATFSSMFQPKLGWSSKNPFFMCNHCRSLLVYKPKMATANMSLPLSFSRLHTGCYWYQPSSDNAIWQPLAIASMLSIWAWYGKCQGVWLRFYHASIYLPVQFSVQRSYWPHTQDIQCSACFHVKNTFVVWQTNEHIQWSLQYNVAACITG